MNQDWTFVPGRPLELGAEFIHGDANPIVELCEVNNWPRRHLFTWSHGDGGPAEAPAPDGGIGYYYLGAEKKLLSFDSVDHDLHACSEALWRLSDAAPDVAEADTRSLRKFLIDEGVPQRMLGLACAGYGNTAGGSSESVPVSKAMRLERGWNADGTEIDPDFRMDGSFGVLIDHLAEGLDVRLGSPVASVVVDSNARRGDARNTSTVTITTKGGQVLKAARAIVAVPLPVLKDGDIAFSPPLSDAKRAAAESMSFANGAKIVLKFSACPWPQECHGVVCADSLIPEMWMNSSQGVGALLTGSAASYPASALGHLQLDVSPDDTAAADAGEDVGACMENGGDSSVTWAEDEVGSVVSGHLKQARGTTLSTTGSSVALSVTHAAASGRASGRAGAAATATATIASSRPASPAGAPPAVLASAGGATATVPAAAAAAAAVADTAADAVYIVTGFIMGKRADELLAAHSQPAIIARMLAQLDAMFGGSASQSYVAGFVHNWGKEEYIRGAYSTPTFKELPDAAARLAAPHAGDTVFFAGEAVAGAVDGRERHLPANRQHFASPIVLHGAMNTGSIAACDVVRSMGIALTCATRALPFSPTYLFEPEPVDVEKAAAGAPAPRTVWRQTPHTHDSPRLAPTAHNSQAPCCTDLRRLCNVPRAKVLMGKEKEGKDGVSVREHANVNGKNATAAGNGGVLGPSVIVVI